MREQYAPSILDRLIDLAPDEKSIDPMPDVYSWEDHILSIRQDLQRLLNTRQHYDLTQLTKYPQSGRSVITYGFPEISSMEGGASTVQQNICRAIEKILRIFEPRLQHPRVHAIGTELTGEAHFRVEAYVKSNGRPRRIVFDTMLDIDRRQYTVEESC